MQSAPPISLNGNRYAHQGSTAARRAARAASLVLVAGLLFVCTGQMCAELTPPVADDGTSADGSSIWGGAPEAGADNGQGTPTDAGPTAEASGLPEVHGTEATESETVGYTTPVTDSVEPPVTSNAAPPSAPVIQKGTRGPAIKPTGPVPQTQLKPIARWDMVPYQRINKDGVLNCGVVAFSKYGISYVRFSISGQGYTGPAEVDVNEMTLNDQSGTFEYWMPIKGSDFTSDGPITVEAAVYGNDGGVRDKSTDGGGLGLDALPLVVNPTGSLPQVEAYVSAGAADGSGAVNDPSRPFGTVGGAIGAIRQYRSSQGLGDNADGGIVRLNPGNHYCSDGGVGGPIPCENEWLTITTAPGGTPDNTALLPGGIVPTRKIAVRGITLNGGGTLGMGYNDRTQTMLWIQGCNLVGSGRANPGAHPLSDGYGALYYTESSISEVQQATSGSTLCRNLKISTISDDAFQNVPIVVNCVVDDVDPLGSGAHADVWQHGGGNDSNRLDDNVIVYNVIATRLMYQSIFIRPDIYSGPSMAQGMAFVNVYMDMLPDAHGWGGWGRWVDHLLWWHVSLTGKGMGFMDESYAGGPDIKCKVTNISVKGCDFAFFGDGGSEIDWSQFDTNHFVDGSLTEGSNVTTGDDVLDERGVPRDGSPLIDRMAPVVPGDANNRVRGDKADIGAFEK